MKIQMLMFFGPPYHDDQYHDYDDHDHDNVYDDALPLPRSQGPLPVWPPGPALARPPEQNRFDQSL